MDRIPGQPQPQAELIASTVAEFTDPLRPGELKPAQSGVKGGGGISLAPI
jgi:hypothetical protein